MEPSRRQQSRSEAQPLRTVVIARHQDGRDAQTEQKRRQRIVEKSDRVGRRNSTVVTHPPR